MATPMTQPPRRLPEHEPMKGKRPVERGSDRVVSIVLSVLVHALIVGALLWGWWQYRKPRPLPQTLAIEGTVVTHATPPRSPAVTHPATVPPPPAVEQARERAEAQQRAAEAAAKLQAAKQAAAKLAAEQAAQQAQQKAAAAAAQQAAQDAEEAAAQRAAAEQAAQEQAARAAAAKAEERRQAREQAAREAKLAAERKAQEEAEERAKEAAELKAKQEAAREARLMAEQLKAEQAERLRESDLQSQLQAEEHLDALQRGPAETEYVNAIKAKITHAWNRPPSAQAGIQCTVQLTQIPGGEVTNVQVGSCNGDDAVRQSVATAVYRASPLPTPPDPALFQANISLLFAPDQ